MCLYSSGTARLAHRSSATSTKHPTSRVRSGTESGSTYLNADLIMAMRVILGLAGLSLSFFS
eukprot:CAMPEP_0202884022 /NCGR_PEP_ID=MMETSP1391-20130828/40319_1 /ASSEMBLY_ACC=CAM_ASM_000867 /TAXON_ID=1034604 /ORGANISM="Chlamydomonas leiostraca, Strain SAG 11-49" /LENGTH=61 /DNA_ID=CAMNT_0049567125 /DNA_START=18 /DNA_END=200 /DNA_ORIENTATION=-